MRLGDALIIIPELATAANIIIGGGAPAPRPSSTQILIYSHLQEYMVLSNATFQELEFSDLINGNFILTTSSREGDSSRVYLSGNLHRD